ncbi:response regulator [bacterium]|nr:response regulator [bacterium]
MTVIKNILYIEDNPGDVKLFREMVSGCSVPMTLHVVRTIKEGKDMIRRHEFDAILLDVELPDSYGLDSVKMLVEASPHTPVIVLTGHQNDVLGVQAIQSGAQDYLIKGIDYTPMIHRIIQNAIERKDIEDQRKAAEQQIRASLIEKETLLKEIHHRVKNNLQIIMSLLNLQSASIRDKQALKIFKESRQRIHSIALVHEKLYKSKNFSEIDFSSYVRSIVHELMRAYLIPEKVEVKIDIQDIYLSIDIAIPLGLIVNELMTNALKYAFPEQKGGHVKISLHSISDQQYALKFSDDGLGFNKDAILKKRGLGLQLVGILTEQLEGHLKIDCEKGSRFLIQFPRFQS